MAPFQKNLGGEDSQGPPLLHRSGDLLYHWGPKWRLQGRNDKVNEVMGG